MITIIHKDLFESDANILIHQVNTEGVMGAGIARTVKAKYPKVFEKYHKVCKSYSVDDLLGKVQLLDTGDGRKICNLFAESLNRKIEGNRRTNYDAFRRAFLSLLDKVAPNTKLAMPYLIGCGLGGGDWKVIYYIIEKCLEQHKDKNLEVEICSLDPLPFYMK